MNATIAYNINSDKALSELKNQSRICFNTGSLKEAYMYHIEHVNVDSYMIGTDGISLKELSSIIEHIKFLNAIITIILYRPAWDIPAVLADDKCICVVNTDREISQCLDRISTVSRDSNRVNWPLHVEFWKQGKKKESLKKDKVLSLSSSGCFIKTDNPQSLEKGDSLAMIFSFTDFDFYSDGIIVRTANDTDGTSGIAVEFKVVSIQTQKCIKEIIDEKILLQIMDTLN